MILEPRALEDIMDYMGNRPVCLIVTNELSPELKNSLCGFAPVGRPKIFRLLYLGSNIEQVAKQLEGVVEVLFPQNLGSYFRHDGSALGRYLGNTIRENSLLVIDWKLNTFYQDYPNGIMALWDAISHHLDRHLVDSVKKSLDTIIMMHFPSKVVFINKDIFVTISALMELARFFNIMPDCIEKKNGWDTQLKTKIDQWRIEKGLFGEGPGPILLSLLDPK